MKTLIICEKKSVAEDIMNFIPGTKTDRKGYYEVKHADGKTSYITFTRGHMFRVCNGEKDKWEIDKLPLFPQKFQYAPSSDFAVYQFNMIKELLKISENIIVATDAGREGELIARVLLEQYNPNWRTQKTVLRLWTSEALSKEVIERELQTLKNISEYDNIYYKALARQHADWIVGINLTRHTTLTNKAGVLSIGRVQTPLLALITERCNEIELFQKEYSYSLVYKSIEGYVFESKYNSSTKSDIEEMALRIQGKRMTVTSVNKGKEEKRRCPNLHSLTSLQREANRYYGYTASQTLEIAQSLYEKHKCLSYPRTDSQHLAESSRELLKNVLVKLGMEDMAKNVDTLDKHIFDNTKLTDHHALIPLAKPNPNMSDQELKVYNLVLDKLKGFFMGDFKFSRVEIMGNVNDIIFRKVFQKIHQSGWKIKTSSNEEESELDSLKQDFREGDVVDGLVIVRQNETKPPRPFSDDTILQRMEKMGLGTPATRADIIKVLESREYIYRKEKHLICTKKGKSLIECKKDSEIIKPEMTADLELKLEQIENENDYNKIIEEIKEYIKKELAIEYDDVKMGLSQKQREYLEKLKRQKGVKIDLSDAEKEDFSLLKEKITDQGAITCKCGTTVKEGEKEYYCSKCKVTVYKKIAGKVITRTAVTKMFKGQKVLVKGLKTKLGKIYDAKLFIENEKINFEFINNNVKP